MRTALKRALRGVGIEIRRAQPGRSGPAPGSPQRPIASVSCFFEDIKARGFVPRGIVDVGANRGDWTRLAVSVFPGVPILMIEPQDEMEEGLSQLANANCHYVKAGAGREEGELVQTIWEDLAGSSFLPEPEPEKLRTGKQRKTRITTLDALLSGPFSNFQPDLIKLDIQGFELEALAGAQSAFGRTEVFILETSLFEYMPHMPITRGVISFMSDRGYELYDITGFLRRPHDGALGQVDLAFVKDKGMFRCNNNW